MKEIAVVILNWNGKDFLAQFLPQVIACSPEAHVVVADNASTDDSVAYVKANFPNVTLIVNQENGGFAKGYNEALKQVDAPYYMLLNSDVEVTENWLAPLLDVMRDSNVAACQPKILSYHQRSYFEHAGASGGYLDRNYFPFCRGRILGVCEVDVQQHESKQEVFWSTGACMLIRSDLFHQAGGFDEDFFAHMEEIDLCWRIKRLGYSCMVEPKSSVYHVGGGTLNYQSPKKTYLNFRNSLYMLVKNHEGPLFFKLCYRMFLDGQAGLFFLVKGEFKHFGAVFSAHVALYKNLKTMLGKRRAFQPDPNKFNKQGMYSGSILWAFYFKGIRRFDRLNARFFYGASTPKK